MIIWVYKHTYVYTHTPREESMNYEELIESAPHNLQIVDALAKCQTQIRNHQKILVSVSGGRDSDVMMDLIVRCGGKDKVTFVFFNTGLEYNATKKQIEYLKTKYDVEIVVVPPIKPIPTCVKEYGVPFWSKHVSEMIRRLQRHNFKWEDKPYDELIQEYPKCVSALKWWCNSYVMENGNMSSFNIGYVPYLKEFILQNPPTFKISNTCCNYAKKQPAKRFAESQNFDLNCVGVRKAEGGIRSTRYKNCYTANDDGPSQYRPIFWFSDEDRDVYDKHYGLDHSDCYSVWGMDRTGCAGCPFSKYFENELLLAEKYEPKMYKAMTNIFGKSYEYRRKFEQFREEMKQKNKV